MPTTTETSEARVKANLANAQKSTGPRTEAGKNTVRFNARRHGLTGQFYCMSEADEQAYNKFEASVLQTLNPEGAYETQLAISIVQDQWRLNRSRATEFNLLGIGHDFHARDNEAGSPNIEVAVAAANTWRDDQKAFANIALYETRIHRMIQKNEKRLAELQSERKAAQEAALEEAKLLLRLAHFNGEVIDSKDQIQSHGFEFSTANLVAEINREELVKEARYLRSVGWSRSHPYRDARPVEPKAA